MKFTVKSGKVKDCIQDKYGAWVTPNKGWLVRHSNGTFADGCSVYEEPIVQPERPLPTATKDIHKAFMDAYTPPIAYNSGDTKDDLLTKIATAID